MKLNIDLAEKHEEMAMSMPAELGGAGKEPEVYYPEFTFREDGPPEFPDEGKMVIEYKKVRSSMDKKAKKKAYSCTLEVHKIISAEGKKEEAENESPTKNDRSTSDALDELANKRSKKKNSDSDEDEGY